ARHGAAIVTYTAMEDFEWAADRVIGVRVADQLTGTRATIRAAAVVNATGPWVDRIRRLEHPGIPPLVRATKGAHVVVPRDRLGHREDIAFLSPIDGRGRFAVPWGHLSYIGTTDTDTPESPDAVAATPDDVVYLLRSANAQFPNARLGMDDVRATWAGLRPLLAPADGAAPASRSREPTIVSGRARAACTATRCREQTFVIGRGGVVSVAGGKLTTYRVMAAEVVDRVLA